MSNDDLKEKLIKCNNLGDVYRLLGIDDYQHHNGEYLKLKANSILIPLGFNLQMFTKENIVRRRYEENPKYCLECGTIIPYERRGAKFCNSSCAAKYNNKNRKLSDYTKEKISKSLKTGYDNHKYTLQNQYCKIEYLENKENLIIKRIYKDGTIKYIDPLKPEKRKNNKNKILYKQKDIKRFCTICGKEFYGHTKTCSPECLQQSRINGGKNGIKSGKERGTWKSWQTRNITSYPEKFWIEVLDNNNIPYTREFFYDKKYFLDFMIIKNGKILDLEIDGHQHYSEERIHHDKERDEYLTNHHVIVYRIPWNCINSENGSKRMKEKIDNFLEFYNNL